jgi:hypothetical protein
MNRMLSFNGDPDELNETMYRVLIGNRFDDMKRYVNSSHTLLNIRKQELEENFKNELLSLPDFQDITTRVYAEHFEDFDRRFVGILMNSTFIATYTLFETIFGYICEFAERRYQLSCSVGDIKESGIVAKCKRYIEDVAHVDLNSVDQYWRQINTERKLRNCMIHDGCIIKAKDIFLTNYVRNHPQLGPFNPMEKRTTTFYIRDKNYVITFCELTHDYLSCILKELLRIPAPTPKPSGK